MKLSHCDICGACCEPRNYNIESVPVMVKRKSCEGYRQTNTTIRLGNNEIADFCKTCAINTLKLAIDELNKV